MKQYTMKELLRMNITTQRKLLSDLNKVAKTKSQRLIKAGFTGEMTKPLTVNAKKTPRDELIRRIEELQAYNRNKLSTVSGMKEFTNTTLTSLQAHGYDFVNKGNLSEFCSFMNMVRDIHGAKAFPSNEVANMYKNMESLGVSPKTIQRKFKEFLSSQEGITDLNMTLEVMSLPEGRKRVTSTDIVNRMKEIGLY